MLVQGTDQPFVCGSISTCIHHPRSKIGHHTCAKLYVCFAFLGLTQVNLINATNQAGSCKSQNSFASPGMKELNYNTRNVRCR